MTNQPNNVSAAGVLDVSVLARLSAQIFDCPLNPTISRFARAIEAHVRAAARETTVSDAASALTNHERNAMNEAVKLLPSVSALRTLRDKLLATSQASPSAAAPVLNTPEKEAARKARAQDERSTAAAIHYPECWDTAAYPTLESALSEVYAAFKCTSDEHKGYGS